MQTVTIEVPQDVLASARLTPAEARVELAVSLYAQGRLGIGKARELAGMSLWQFRQLLGARQIPPHVDTEDINADLTTLQQLERA